MSEPYWDDPRTTYRARRPDESDPWHETDSPRVAEALSRCGHIVTAETRGVGQ